MQTCPKCGYVRKPTDSAPGWQCPSCGIAYAKFGTVPQGRAHKPVAATREPTDSVEVIPASAIHERSMGPEILRCRPLRPTRFDAPGFSVITKYVILPALVLVLAIFAVAGVFGIGSLIAFLLTDDGLGRSTARAFFWLVVPVYVVSIWWFYFFMYRKLREDCLIVCQGGFRLKYGDQACAPLFDEVAELDVGRDSSTGAWNINVVLHSGDKITFPGCLLRFEPEDMEKFFDYIEQRHPKLLKTRPTLARSPRNVAVKLWLIRGLATLVIVAGLTAFADEQVLPAYRETVTVANKTSRNYSDAQRGTGVEFQLHLTSNT